MVTCNCKNSCDIKDSKKSLSSKLLLPFSLVLVILGWQFLGVATPLPYTLASSTATDLSALDSSADTADLYDIILSETAPKEQDSTGEEPAFTDNSTDIIEAVIGDVEYSMNGNFDPRQVDLAYAALNFALNQVGKPYIAATRGPNSYDCSGLTYAAYRNAGLNWPMMTSYNQRNSKYVTKVAPGSEMPGDLIFTDFLRDGSQIPRGLAGPKGVDHVSMVIDPVKGLMVEAVGGRGVVVRKYHENGKYIPQLISFGRVDFPGK